jgi:hypothetical protein
MENIRQHHFLKPEGGGEGGLWDTYSMTTDLVRIATLKEFDETDRIYTTFCDPHMSSSLRHFFTFHPKKETKECFQEKCLK